MTGARRPKENWRWGRTQGRRRFSIVGERWSVYAGIRCTGVTLPLERNPDISRTLTWGREVAGSVGLSASIVWQTRKIKWVDFIRAQVVESSVESEYRGFWFEAVWRTSVT